MHHRQRIRVALASRLLAANTLAGPNVFTSRARPVLEILQKREAVLSVYTADESSQRATDGYLLERTLTVSVEGLAGGGDDLDDVLDTFAQQVEDAVNTDPTLAALLTDELVLTASTSEITARGNQQVGAFRLDFECSYLTERGVDANLGPEPPVPTQITTSVLPTADAYTPAVNGIRPSTIEHGAVSPARQPLADEQPCADGSCEVPAWTGDQP